MGTELVILCGRSMKTPGENWISSGIKAGTDYKRLMKGQVLTVPIP